MKSKYIKTLYFKSITAALLSCVLIITASVLVAAQVDEIIINSDENKPELKSEDNNEILNNIPHTNMDSDSALLVLSGNSSNLNETVIGLSQAGYTISEIVSILKNDNREASQISIACLKAGFNGTSIFQALKGAGFSESESESAVPAALRTQRQPLSASNSVNLKTNTIIQEEKVNSSSNIDPMEVPVSVGVKFNGLGNWNDFQNNRFNQER